MQDVQAASINEFRYKSVVERKSFPEAIDRGDFPINFDWSGYHDSEKKKVVRAFDYLLSRSGNVRANPVIAEPATQAMHTKANHDFKKRVVIRTGRQLFEPWRLF
jgi:hypothetical protein